jgi:type I restriction enzyme S subunit
MGGLMSRLVPKLRFKEFSGEWEERKLGGVVKFLDGKRKPIKESDRANMQGEYPYYGASGIIDYVNDFIFDEDIILLSEDGENIVSRNLPLVFKVAGKSWVNNHAHVLKPQKLHKLDFLVQYMENLSYVRYNSGGAQPKLNQAVCKTIPLILPIPKEQQKIASCLSSLDSLIEAQNKKVSALKQHKKGLMQQLFPAEGEREPKLRFKAFSGEWVEKKLGDVAIKKSSNILANTLVNNKGKYSIYGASGYLQNIDFYNEDDPYIAIIKDGSGVGKSFLCVEKSSIIGTLQVIKPLNKDNLAFLYFLINKIDFSKYISGGAIPHIYFKDYSKEIIKIPSPPEQQKIANTLSTLDNLIEAQNQKIAQLKQHKKALMQQMFVSNEVGA